MFAYFSLLLKLEVYELIFSEHTQKISQKGNDREQYKEYRRVPGRDF